jgi:hypothetical protein
VAQGAEKAGLIISVIEDQGGSNRRISPTTRRTTGRPTVRFSRSSRRDSADHDGAVGRPYPDPDIWNTINYIKSLAQKKQ